VVLPEEEWIKPSFQAYRPWTRQTAAVFVIEGDYWLERQFLRLQLERMDGKLDGQWMENGRKLDGIWTEIRWKLDGNWT
jgi:hypothetical protein